MSMWIMRPFKRLWVSPLWKVKRFRCQKDTRNLLTSKAWYASWRVCSGATKGWDWRVWIHTMHNAKPCEAFMESTLHKSNMAHNGMEATDVVKDKMWGILKQKEWLEFLENPYLSCWVTPHQTCCTARHLQELPLTRKINSNFPIDRPLLFAKSPWKTWKKIIKKNILYIYIKLYYICIWYSWNGLEWQDCQQDDCFPARDFQVAPNTPWRTSLNNYEPNCFTAASWSFFSIERGLDVNMALTRKIDIYITCNCKRFHSTIVACPNISKRQELQWARLPSRHRGHEASCRCQ